MITLAAAFMAFLIGFVVGRYARPGRLLPFLPSTPVTVWTLAASGHWRRHEWDEGEYIGVVVPDDAQDLCVVQSHPRDIYVAEAFAPQYEG